MKRFVLLLLVLGRMSVSATAAESNLPVIELKPAQSIRSMETVPCTVSMRFPSDTNTPAMENLGGRVRYHGASSQMHPKKSFALTLDSPAAWQGLHESRSWVLNAAYIDRSLMRHKLSYDLFLSLSKDGAKRFASGSRFVEVTVKGRYHGVYLLMERIDGRLLELRRYDSNAVFHACIYKAEDHSANFASEGHWGYEQREPSAEVFEYWEPLDKFNAFVSQTSDAMFFHLEKGIASRLDMDNAIDFHLLVLMTCNKDGIDKNFMIARDAPTATGPKPKFFFVPWDYDATFGRSWDASRLRPDRWLSNHLFDRLLGNETYREKYRARWKELRSGPFAVTNIVKMMDENARTLGAAVKRNELRWDTPNGNYPDQLTFEEDLEEMKAWLVERTRWMDSKFLK